MQRRKQIVLFIAACIFLPSLFWPQIANAKSCDLKRPAGRCLGGHLFLPSLDVPEPFLTTTFSTLFGVGQANIKIDKFNERGARNGQKDFGILGLRLGYGLQIAFLDWLAIGGKILSQGITTSLADIKSVTLKGELDWQLGALFRLWHSQHFIVSAAADVVQKAELDVTPIRGVSTILQEGTVGPKALRQMIGTAAQLGGKLTALVGWGINPVFGGWAVVSYKHLFLDQKNLADFTGVITAGGGVSVDLRPATTVPLGVLFSGTYDFVVSETSRDILTSLLAGGLFYTGRDDFSLGLEVRYRIYPIGLNEPERVFVSDLSGVVMLRYFWN